MRAEGDSVRTTRVLDHLKPYESSANRFPLTNSSPGTEPAVVQTWLARLTFSYPGPCGTRVSVWITHLRVQGLRAELRANNAQRFVRQDEIAEGVHCIVQI